MNFTTTSICALLLSSCATASRLQPEFADTRVLERMGNVSETPDWSLASEPLSSEGGNIFFTSTIAMSGDSRPEACTNAAADIARVQILRQIKDNLTSSGQLNEVSASSDPSIESLTAYLAQGSLFGIRVSKRYWEKREESDTNGMRVLRVHCTSQVGITRSLLEKQMRAAIDGEGDGNPQIRQKLIEAQTQFINSLAEKPAKVTGETQTNLTTPINKPRTAAESDVNNTDSNSSRSE
jgi:hypothetical protein